MHLNKIEMPCINEDQIRELMQTEKLPSKTHLKKEDHTIVRGMVQMVLRRGDGSGLYVAHENLITTKGFDLVCDVLGKNAQPDDLSHIGIGTGTTAAAAAQTALVTQNAREIAVYAHVAGTKVFTMVVTFAPGTGTGAVTEAGCFNAASSGTMFNRVLFAAVNKATADSLTVTFTFTFS